jgi:hypothetical protein
MKLTDLSKIILLRRRLSENMLARKNSPTQCFDTAFGLKTTICRKQDELNQSASAFKRWLRFVQAVKAYNPTVTPGRRIDLSIPLTPLDERL